MNRGTDNMCVCVYELIFKYTKGICLITVHCFIKLYNYKLPYIRFIRVSQNLRIWGNGYFLNFASVIFCDIKRVLITENTEYNFCALNILRCEFARELNLIVNYWINGLTESRT